MAEEKKKIVTQEDMMKLLDSLYQRVLDGVPKLSPPVEEMANDYLKKNLAKDRAIRAMTKKPDYQMHDFRSYNRLWRTAGSSGGYTR